MRRAAFLLSLLLSPAAQAGQPISWDQHFVARMGVIDLSAYIAGPGQIAIFGDSNTEMFGWVASGACKVVNAGFGGATTAELADRAQWVAGIAKPRLSHIMAGTNDIARATPVEAFARDLTRIVRIFQAAGSAVVLWELPPTRVDMGSAERHSALNRAVREVARATGVASESRLAIGLVGADGYAAPGALLTDGIHLSGPSQKARKAVIDEWSMSARCR